MDNEVLPSSACDVNLDFTTGMEEDAINGNGSLALDESLLIEAGFAGDSTEMKVNGDMGASAPEAVGSSSPDVPCSEQQLSGISLDFGGTGGAETAVEVSAGTICPPPAGFQDSSPRSSSAAGMSVDSEQNGSTADVNGLSTDQHLDLGVHLDFGEPDAAVQPVSVGNTMATSLEPTTDQNTADLGDRPADVAEPPVDTGVCIHLESKDELCHLSEPTVQTAAVVENKEQEEDKLNPEEEEAAMKFLQLQAQKKQEDEFDDEFDIEDLPAKPPTVAAKAGPTKVTVDPGRVGSSTFYTSGQTGEEVMSKSTVSDVKVTHEEKSQVSVGKTQISQEKTEINQGMTHVYQNTTQAERSVFYTETTNTITKETKEIIGGSIFYTPATAAQNNGNIGGNGDGIVRPMTAGKEITQLNENSEASLVQTSGLVIDPNERSQDYSLDGNKTGSGATSHALQAAKAEWDTVETITPAVEGDDSDDDSVEGITGAAHVKTTPSITYEEGLACIKDSNLIRYKSQIRPTVQRGAWGSFKHAIFGPPKLHKNLVSEKEIVFLIAACPFDNREDPHFQILQTIYKKLTGSKFDCQRYGDHWELIGFQGNDPSTDLRATGLLGLLTVLYLVMDEKTASLARDIYKLSLHETQNFPFCVMSINMTRIALQGLREESLNKECNRRQSVMDVFNDIYTGTYLYMYQLWKSQHKTIKDSGYVIKDVETFVKKNPKGVLKNLDTYLADRSSGRAMLEDGNILNFAGVCDMGANEEDGDLV
ncbi:uncharacterized protein LOC135489280 [Lineus longissimus]|uniref:uncharacterized protein LOC135489280 n=1 Tax=Lineus longissimus TaxID=88925 RepID=UPI002B4E2B6D